MRAFIQFIREQGVIGLAIGFMLGGAASNVVSSFVNGIVNPFIGIFFKDFDALDQVAVSVGSAEIAWGLFAAAVVDFIILAGFVFFIFKRFGMEKLDTPREHS